MKGVKDDKGDKKNKSVAESLNAVVKTHLVTMSEQYNVYATAILEMEEKIKSLKQIMLSQEFLNNIRDVNLSCPVSVSVSLSPSSARDNKKEKGNNKENTIISNIKIEAETANSEELIFFTPRQKDSLFWCFNIIANGLGQYEYEKNYFTAEQEFKVKTIEQIKKGENKQILKEHKMSKNMIETGLMGSRTSGISPKILYALSLFYNVNIFYIYKNTYYEMFANANADTDIAAKIHIIKFNPETNYYSVCSSMDMGEGEGEGESQGQGKTKILEYIKNSKKSCLELDNLDDVNKPLRPITSYSLTDLINIATKMNILDTHIHDESVALATTKKKLKSKTKNELYTEIMQKCL